MDDGEAEDPDDDGPFWRFVNQEIDDRKQRKADTGEYYD